MSKTSNPQKRRRSSQNRPTFVPNLAAGGTGVDLVSGVTPVTSISGTRYGIVNNIVTQFEVDKTPIEDDGLRGCPAFTQLCKQSETLTDAVWNKNGIGAYSVSGSYQGQNVWVISENTATSTHSILQTGPFVGAPDNSVIGLSFIYKANGRAIQIVLRSKDGTFPTLCIISATGTISAKNASATVSSEPLGDSYYRITATIPCGAGAINPYVYWQMWNGSASNYTGNGVSGVYISQPTYINFGVNGIPFIPPYVPNNTTGSISVVSEAATTTTGTSFDFDDVKLARLKTALRGPSAQGHLELDFVSNIDSGWLANNSYANIFAINNTQTPGGVQIRKTSEGSVYWYFNDGINNNASVLGGVSPMTIYKISLDWGTHSTGPKMRITVNGVKSSLINFSGSFGTQDLRFFYSNTIHAGWIVKDSLKVMDRPQW